MNDIRADKTLESFIPIRRSELVELCLADGGLSPEQAGEFRDFCEILAAYYHFRFHARLERLKDHYAPFNPDADTLSLQTPDPQRLRQLAQVLADDFADLLARANYQPLSEEDLAAAFKVVSLIPLQTDVDFADYEQVRFFYRGEGQETVTFRRLWRTRSVVVDNFQRVAVLLKFREPEYFQGRKKRLTDLGFVPGKIYLYLYKNIPRNDLELIFPNVEVSMNWKDRLLLLVPALGAAIPLILKVLPSLGLLAAAILLLTIGPEVTERLGLGREVPGNFYALLAAVLSIGAALGGFATAQYAKYKSKRLMFLKKVTDTLFFKNLVTNEGVLHSLSDAAEEELSKEAILVCYHLLTARTPLDRAALDAQIEAWMQERLAVHVDFDIDKTLEHLAELQAEFPGAEGAQRRSLLTRQPDGELRVLTLAEAKRLVDQLWDHAFEYANAADA